VIQDWPGLDAIVVPIGGGGLISGVAMAVKGHNPRVRVIGVESSDGPAMQRSVQSGRLETIECRTVIDGLRVRRVGEINFDVVRRYVDDIVTLPDREIFDAMIWVMERCKLVVEGAAAAPVAALLHGLVKLPAGSKVVAVLSGGNVNLDSLRALTWN
jgi:threonine dehydratase